MEYERLVRKYRKKPVANFSSASSVVLNYGKDEIKRLIPHREPFLMIHSIEKVDLKEGWITGKRYIDPDDPIFKGHFPGFAIYPGVLHIEMIGQLALCYYCFARDNTTKITDKELNVRVTKVYHTLFQHEVLPNDELLIAGKVIEYDAFKFKGIGQVIKGNKICTIAVAEFFIM